MIQYVLKKLHRIILIHKLTVHSSLIEYNLYFGQLPLLRFVCDNPKCTQREIANSLCVSPPSVTNSIKRLEKNGYLLKQDDPENLRKSRILITSKGKETLILAEKTLHSIDNSLFYGFSKQELDQFDGFVTRIQENLSSSKYSDKSISTLANEFSNINTNNKEN